MAGSDDDIAPYVPLPPAPLHIVLALNRGERHGYGLMADVQELSGGVIKMGPGTLYGSIKKLLAQGLIEESPARPDPTLDNERRRYYRLTGLGQRVCHAELERLATLLDRSRSGAAARLLGRQA